MSRRVGILVIHGMGSQRPGYARDLIGSVGSSLARRSDRLVWKEIHWADALKSRETRLLCDMDAALTPDGATVDLRWRRTRTFVLHNFGDAIAYHRDSSVGSAYRVIHGIVSSSIADLNAEIADPLAPVVVLAHSLGGHIMSNYIWDRQREDGHIDTASDFANPDEVRLEPLPTLTSFITFGCSIPLFSLSFDVAEPILLPAPDVPGGPVRSVSRWINLLDPDDVLAWPIRPLYSRHAERLGAGQRATLERIEDRMIDAGGLLTGWNPASHTSYDTDDDLTTVVADHLRELLDALDGWSNGHPPISGPA